jgi:hypothetical protein
MRLARTFIALGSVLSLVVTPAVAVAKSSSTAAVPSVQGLKDVRAGSKVRKSEKATSGTIVAVLAVIAGGLGVAAAAGAFESDSNSP